MYTGLTEIILLTMLANCFKATVRLMTKASVIFQCKMVVYAFKYDGRKHNKYLKKKKSATIIIIK